MSNHVETMMHIDIASVVVNSDSQIAKSTTVSKVEGMKSSSSSIPDVAVTLPSGMHSLNAGAESEVTTCPENLSFLLANQLEELRVCISLLFIKYSLLYMQIQNNNLMSMEFSMLFFQPSNFQT